MKAIHEFLLIYGLVFAFLLFLSLTAAAQTTSFTYQGRLSDSNLAANGTYEMQFSLFDAESAGNQIGQPQANAAVSVVNGIFTVNLDFGADSFPGTGRYLQIAVRAVGNPNPHTLMTPRQAVTSAPYAVKSLNSDTAGNANQLGGIDANQYVTGQVVRSLNNLTDNVTLAAGSNITITPAGNTLTIASSGGGGSGILNQTSLQSGANFNIDGTGKADAFDSTQYNIGGNRVLSVAGNHNLFAGIGAGTNNMTGTSNSFFGYNAGLNHTSGHNNVFSGSFAGAGNISGTQNTFIGLNAGNTNKFGINNTVIGASANVAGDDLSFATAIGAGVTVFGSNRVQIGRSVDTVLTGGKLFVGEIELGGTIALCGLGSPGSSYIATCSSSLRYKTNIASFGSGLNLVSRLKPITFDWKADGTHDLGLGAEDVAAVEPLLVTYNQKGEVEGVKYDRIGVVLLNAVKEQQTRIDTQQEQVQQLQLVIEGLKKLVCGTNAQAEECREEK